MSWPLNTASLSEYEWSMCQALWFHLLVFLDIRVDPIRTLPQLETGITFQLSTQQSTPTRPISSHTWMSPSAHSAEGVYVGEGIPPVPMRLAAKSRRGEFTDMGELLTEFWSMPCEEDPKQEAKSRRSQKVTDIFTWLQCFMTYVSVLAPQQPWRIPKLMAYMANIVQVSQDCVGWSGFIMMWCTGNRQQQTGTANGQ